MKNKNLLLFLLGFVVIVAFGIVFNNLMINERARIAEEKENIINLVKHLGVVGELEEENLRRPLEEGDTRILQRFNGYNKAKELVAFIYVGETKGYKEDLHVAYAIDVKTHKVVGFKLLENNETEKYVNALLIEDFTKQFKDKDLSDKQMKVEAISGATPGGKEGVIAPATTGGMDKILKLVRKQYDKDSEFTAPALLELKSAVQDYTDPSLNFVYIFLDEGTEVKLVVSRTYEFVSITDSAVQEDAMVIANENKVKNYISDVKGDVIKTITIKSEGFSGSVITSTAVADGTTITSFSSDLSTQSYDWDGGTFNFNPVFDAVKNREGTIPAVSGATVSRNGVAYARDVLYAYLGVE